MVCFAWAGKGLPTTTLTRYFAGSRADVRRAAVVAALEGLIVCAEAIRPYWISRFG
jgi:nicotinamide mononucleotide (NMN) deamidase PncC